MSRILLSTALALLAILLLARGEAQTYDQEFVGTVTCPSCIAKNSRKVDLSCARACFSPKKTTDSTQNTSSEPGQSPVPDVTENAPPTPPKPATTDVGLVIMTDDNKTIPVDNPEKVKSHLAHRVDVTGYWIKGSFHVTSVRTL